MSLRFTQQMHRRRLVEVLAAAAGRRSYLSFAPASSSSTNRSSLLVVHGPTTIRTASLWSLRKLQVACSRRLAVRALSTDKEPPKKNPEESSGDEDTTKEIVLTPGQKVAAATRLTFWAGIGVFAAACAYYIGMELVPT